MPPLAGIAAPALRCGQRPVADPVELLSKLIVTTSKKALRTVPPNYPPSPAVQPQPARTVRSRAAWA